MVCKQLKKDTEFDQFHPVAYVWQIYWNVPSLHNI